MRKSVLIAVATVSVLGACGQAEQAPAKNETAATNAAAPAAAAAAAAAAPVSADKAQALFHERHEGMENIGKSTKTIRAALESSSPDITAIKSSAATIADLAGKSSG